MSRAIIHADADAFYASVEALYFPALRGKPVAVSGIEADRHGIVLAKSYEAKKYGIKTGNPTRLARQLCPALITVDPHPELYEKVSMETLKIYNEYTDLVESFGLDEATLDVTGSLRLFGGAETIARTIKAEVREKLGINVSIGISFCKEFAKLASDLAKPSGIFAIPEDGWQEIVWPLPVGSLLGVGLATQQMFYRSFIRTIGDLARCTPDFLKRKLGKNGEILWTFANGHGTTRVSNIDAPPIVKSVGNSHTTPFDLNKLPDVKSTVLIQAENISERLRAMGVMCRTVQVSFNKTDLTWFQRQIPLPRPAFNTTTIYDAAMRLYHDNAGPKRPGCYTGDSLPLRAIGVRACNLEHWSHAQCSLYEDETAIKKQDDLDGAIDHIRGRFGYTSVQRGALLLTPELAAYNPRTQANTFRRVGS